MSGIFDQIINYSPPLIVSGTVNYKGTWNASTNNPTLNSSPASSTKGDYYVVSTAGTQFGITFAIGDWIISNGTAWEKVDLTDAVSSVFGRTGAVVGVSTDYSAVGLTNTAIGASNPSTGAFTTVSATTPIAGTSGGTGVNNGANTITIAGNVTHAGAFTQSFTATANTSLTLPVTGTLATLAGSEALSNKTITASAFNGTVGATTPSTVAATSLTTTSGITVGAGSDFFNGSVRISDSASSTAPAYFQSGEPGISGSNVIVSNNYYGSSGGASGRRNSSVGASYLRLNVGAASTSTATIGVISASGTMSDVAAFSSTGLAVTGSLSTTQSVTATGGFVIGNDNSFLYDSGTGAVTLRLGASGPYGSFLTNSGEFMVDGPSGTLALGAGGTRVATISSTGLAVTGALSATGAIEGAHVIRTNGPATADKAASAAIDYASGFHRAWCWGPDTSTVGQWKIRLAKSDGSSAIEPLAVDSLGNVGIGTTTIADIAGGTSRTLEIYGGSAGGGSFLHITNSTTGQTTNDGFVMGISGGASDVLFIQRENANMSFRTNNTDRMRIDGSGGVAIGTTPFSDTRFTVVPSGDYAPAITVRSSSSTANWARLDLYNANTAGPLIFGQDNSGFSFIRNDGTNSEISFQTSGGVERAKVSSTGLAVTGQAGVTSFTGTSALGVRITGSTSTNDYSGIDFSTTTAAPRARIGAYYSSSGSYLVFGTSNSYGSGITNNALTIDYSGNVSISGALSKGSGSFRIEHPLPEKSATHQLVHSFIEGPQADLIYRGKVTLIDGKASVNIDAAATMTEGTFEVLCRDVQCFTTNETGWTAVRGKVTGNILTIEARDADCTDEISWMVIGERCDPHMMETDWTDDNGKVIVEPLKPVQPIQ